MEEINYAVGSSSNLAWANFFKLNSINSKSICFGLSVKNKNQVSNLSANSFSYLLVSQEISQQIQKLFQKNDFENNLKQNINDLVNNYPDLDINLCIFYLEEELLKAFVFGEINIFLKRDNKVIQLLSGKSADFQILKGQLKENDEVVFTNSKYNFEVIKEDLLASEIFIKYDYKQKFDFIVHNYQEEKEQKEFKENFVNKKNIFSKFNFRKKSEIAIRPDTIDFESRRKKTLTPIFGVILLLALIISITLGVRKKKNEEIKKDISSSILEIQVLIEDAKKIEDSAKARSYLNDAKNKANELVLKYPDNSDSIDIQNAVNLSFSQIAGIIEKNASLYLDLGLITSNFKGDGLYMNSDYMVLYDNNDKKIVSIETDTKKTKTISDSQLVPSILSASVYDKKSYVLSSDGIREVTNTVELFVKPDGWISRDILFKAFAGNIYILDKVNNKIYRYIGVRGGFLEKEDWLAPGIIADFSSAIDMVIDGSIWVLYSDGDIWKYLQGAPQKINVSYPQDLSKNLKFYTDENYEEFYVLDSDNGRIFEFSKNGEYQKEYSSNDLRQAQSFVVSNAYQKIIFLKDAKLWEIQMN